MFFSFPSQPDKIDEKLFISDYPSACSKEALLNLKISHVCSAVSLEARHRDTFRYLVLDIDDSDEEDIIRFFPPALHFIAEAMREGTGVLIHCAAGISRSSTLAIMYLMTTRNIPFTVAKEIVKRARPCIAPNPMFERQLRLWETMRFTVQGDTRAHKQYRLVQLLRRKSDRELDERHFDELQISDVAQPVFRCKECNIALFTRDHVLDGPPGEGFMYGGAKAVVHDEECEEFLVYPLRWMVKFGVESKSEGDLLCPGDCGEALGKFTWMEDDCACGASVHPSFRINKQTIHFK